MPGAGGMIGLRYADSTASKKQRPTSQLSAQVRNLARLLKRLEDPETAVVALEDALQQTAALSCHSSRKKQYSHNNYHQAMLSHWNASLDLLRQEGWKSFKNHGCIEIAQALENAFLMATGKQSDAQSIMAEKKRRTRSAYSQFFESYSLDNVVKGHAVVKMAKIVANAWANLSWNEKMSLETTKASSPVIRKSNSNDADHGFWGSLLPRRAKSTRNPAATMENSTRAYQPTAVTTALVSDSEDAFGTATLLSNQAHGVDVDGASELTLMDFWPNLLEAVNIQICSRTTRTWGRKKVYEIYRLGGSTTSVSDVQQIRSKIAKAFLSMYGAAQNNRHSVQYNDCRVFAAQRSEALWIQINIGLTLDVHSATNRSVTGEKKKKACTEYLAVILPESNLVALTASRAASRSPFTPYVLSALEKVLTCSTTGGYASELFIAQRIHDLSGTEPFDLIRTAKAIEDQDAVGRFASYATSGASVDPISDLQSAATGSLLSRAKQQDRLNIGAKHGRSIADLSSRVAEHTNGAARLVAVNNAGMCVDHSAKGQANRKRSRQIEFGEDGNCPRRQCMKWDWKGLTTAPAASLLDPTATTSLDKSNRNLPSVLFKCRVQMKGSDVFAGMKALMDAGVMKGPLPAYVRDAPMLGGKICVNHGAIVSSSSQSQSSSSPGDL